MEAVLYQDSVSTSMTVMLEDRGMVIFMNWTWRKVCTVSAGGPGKNAGCRMISYHHDQLLVVGGYYGKTPSSRQAGASYDVYWKTNENHSYNMTTGKR